MALYNKWSVKNNFAFVLQIFSLISDGLGGVTRHRRDYRRRWCDSIDGVIRSLRRSNLLMALLHRTTTILLDLAYIKAAVMR